MIRPVLTPQRNDGKSYYHLAMYRLELEKYCTYIEQHNEDLEKLNKKYIEKYTNAVKCEREAWESFVNINSALYTACVALAKHTVEVQKGDTSFCSTNAEAYYNFLRSE